MPAPLTRRNLVVVGDGACGKTSLLIVFSEGKFPTKYLPTVFENHVADITIDNVPVELTLWDTAGQEEYDRLRPLSYPDTHVVIICYAVDSPDSLENVREKWMPEVKHYCHQDMPVVLVGCKADLRVNEGGNAVTTTRQQGVLMQREIGAGAYAECSAKTGVGVHEVFQIATRAALAARCNFESSVLVSSGRKGRCK
ncbi:GTP-binding protein, rho subfamily [Mycena amicta]|nr:GTP-binding protein, rho subfamily [Mycena amicta]